MIVVSTLSISPSDLDRALAVPVAAAARRWWWWWLDVASSCLAIPYSRLNESPAAYVTCLRPPGLAFLAIVMWVAVVEEEDNDDETPYVVNGVGLSRKVRA
jgi:hypothetical protein